MKSLQTFFGRLTSWYATLIQSVRAKAAGGSLEGRLAADELITRFIHTDKNIATDKKNVASKRPRPNAFQPPADLELSTAHITQLADNDIWILARSTLTQKRRKVYARADLKVADVLLHNLVATRDNDPFERHTVVTGWPNPPDPDERKSRTQAICLALCHADSLNMAVLDAPIVWES